MANLLTAGRGLFGRVVSRLGIFDFGGAGGGVKLRLKKVAVGALTTGEKDTGFDLPLTGFVLDAWVNIKTAEVTATTKTMDVGLLSSETGGDTNGFLAAVSTASTGRKTGAVTYTDGVNQNYISTNLLGALLFEGLVGADVAGQAGTLNRRAHNLNGTAKSLVYQLGSAHTELVADIYVLYLDFD